MSTTSRVLAKEGKGREGGWPPPLLLKFSLMWIVKPQECFDIQTNPPPLFLSWLKHCTSMVHWVHVHVYYFSFYLEVHHIIKICCKLQIIFNARLHIITHVHVREHLCLHGSDKYVPSIWLWSTKDIKSFHPLGSPTLQQSMQINKMVLAQWDKVRMEHGIICHF